MTQMTRREEQKFTEDMTTLYLLLTKKDTKGFRKHIISLLDKLNQSATRDFYKEQIDKACMEVLNKHFETLFYRGLN